MSHVWRPLFVVIALVALILLARSFFVPDDFGVHGAGYMYGWHRLGNETEWKAVPTRYRTSDDCPGCHDQGAAIGASPHRMIPCENCHGPAREHPEDPGTLPVEGGRDLCLRCHAQLPYPGSDRNALPGIDPAGHNPGEECRACHNPHDPSLEGME